MGVDVTGWHFTQFRIDELVFIIREDRSRYDLVAKKQCKKCKAWLHSYPVNSLLDLGAILTNDNGWAMHTCRPKQKPRKIQEPTIEQKLYDLVTEVVELVVGERELRNGM